MLGGPGRGAWALGHGVARGEATLARGAAGNSLSGMRRGVSTDRLVSQPGAGAECSRDQPVAAKGRAELEEYQAVIAPYVKRVRETYPDARRRFLAGLAAGHHFFAVTNLHDVSGGREQVFIAVSSIRDGSVNGRIASDLLGVRGFMSGDPYSFPESELLDWVITRPDGSEEGNVVGKFLDEWQKTRPRK